MSGTEDEPTGREKALADFLEPGPLPEGADLPDAEARLLSALEKEIGVTIAPGARPGPAVARTTPATGPGRGSLLDRLFGGTPLLRPALALAAVAVVAFGVWSQVRPAREDGGRLRGPAASPSPGTWLALPHSASLGDGRVRLAWSPAAHATGYAVVFLGEDLTELARVGDLRTVELVLERDDLPAGLHSGQVVLWRVTAVAGGDEIARSATSPLTLP